MDKKYFECELAVITDVNPYGMIPVDLLMPGPALDGIREGGVFAEVNIPLNLEDADYCYVCHIINLPNFMPAFAEMISLKNMVEEIHEKFSAFAKDMTPMLNQSAPTLSGLYNCEVCGEEKCSRPGICDDCLAPPTEFELNQEWEE